MMIILSYFFFLFIPQATSLTFSFADFIDENQKYLQLMSDASYFSDGIQLTPDEIYQGRLFRAGRATYVEPFHLWKKTSGELASFTTYFSFLIDSNMDPNYGDGLTFFIAENNSVITSGPSLGLPIDGDNINMNPFVAVEFDTFQNEEWDPRNSTNNLIGDHVGININSLKSVATEKWFSNITGGKVCKAWISYDSVSKNLSVSFTGFRDNREVNQSIYHIIDLREVLPQQVIIGFSAATGILFQLNNVKSWAFNSSVLTTDEDNKERENRTGLEVGLIVGFSILVTFVGVLVFLVWKKKKSREHEELFDVEMENEFEMGTGPRKFSYQELARSTGDFAEDQKLGEGGFGGVYRGYLKELSTHVAVKRVSKGSKQGIKEYASEVRIISKLRHKNLVQLTGWCHERGELLLVYEFMENGSLDLHLFKAKSLLTWGLRYKIAHGLASALLYLHEEWEQCVLHRDIKSSNVMLDSNFNAKLGDFGLAKLVDHEKGSQTTMLAGTLGYMAPECVVTGKATRESDVFSFGIVALEIACGRKTIAYMAPENQIRLVEWVWEVYGNGTLLEAVDPCLGSDYEEEEIKRVMIIGLWCAHPDSHLRPSMRQVIQVLNSEASLPTLPAKMPVASYLSSPMSSLSFVTSITQDQSSSSSSNMGSSKQKTLSTRVLIGSPSDVSLLDTLQ